MPPDLDTSQTRPIQSGVYQTVSTYSRSDRGKAIWQVINTFIPYFALWLCMIALLRAGYSYWIILLLSILTAGFHIRIFILFHDCCHGSFFAGRRANRILGYFSGILTFTPFDQWRHSHAVHHATVGDLDRRGVGDVWTLTVEEYLELPRLKRIAYRIYRNPFVMFGLGPSLVFLLGHRFPHKNAKKRERSSVILTNIAIVIILVLIGVTIGLKTYLLILAPMLIVAGAFGVWLFYVQHQFEGVYWARREEWDPLKASIEGSSFYKLPKILNWFTGSIGFHHIHHVQPGIPNYHLQECSQEVPELRSIEPLTVRQSLRSLKLNLWDENEQALVSFRSLKAPSISG